MPTKMRNTFHLLLFAFLLLLCEGCLSGFASEKQMYSWLNDPDHGLVKTKNINGLNVTVKYMPPDFLAYTEYINAPQGMKQSRDSLLMWYKKNLTFLISISLDENNKSSLDIMRMGVTNYSEYREKFLALNFDLSESISLKSKTKSIKPVLTNLENVYGASQSRNITIVFSPQDLNEFLAKSRELDFVYDDEVFSMGIMHYKFNLQELTTVPEIKFWKNQ